VLLGSSEGQGVEGDIEGGSDPLLGVSDGTMVVGADDGAILKVWLGVVLSVRLGVPLAMKDGARLGARLEALGMGVGPSLSRDEGSGEPMKGVADGTDVGSGEPIIGAADGRAVGNLVGKELIVDPKLGEEVLIIPPVGFTVGSIVGTTDWPKLVGNDEGESVSLITLALGDSLSTVAVGLGDFVGDTLEVGAPVGLAVIVGALVIVGITLGTVLETGAFVFGLLFFDDFLPDLD
jgi:hypothetical protein